MAKCRICDKPMKSGTTHMKNGNTYVSIRYLECRACHERYEIPKSIRVRRNAKTE